MKITLIIAFFVFSCLIMLASAFAVNAQESKILKSLDNVAEGIVLGVGRDETERNVAYFSSVNVAGEIRVALASDVESDVFPNSYTSFYSSCRTAVNLPGKFAKAATITGLSESTKYAYVIVEVGVMSEIYYFETGGFGDFEFVFVGDPQISTQAHSESWQDTMQKILNSFNTQLLISAGDQVVKPDSEEQYSYFLVDELAKIAFAPTVGPVHDSQSATFSDHYNLPNLSSKYGKNETSANYWYRYNNTLFMHLNMSDTGASTNGEHKNFMIEAMAQNPDAMWNIVIMHTSLYSTSQHGDPNYTHFPTEVGKYRPALSPVFTELGIDVVLSGHDHVYVRSNLMDGVNVSTDVVVNNSVKDPYGILYICASSSTGSKYGDKLTDGDFIAFENYEKNKSAIKVAITGESITLTSYFLDDMQVFDTFKIEKTPHVCAPKYVEGRVPTCTLYGQREYYSCACGRAYEDVEGRILIEDLASWKFISALGHDYLNATCSEPKTCNTCGATVGKRLGHDFDGVCDTECNRCDYLRDAAEHTDSDSDRVCDICTAELSVDNKLRAIIPVVCIITGAIGVSIAMTAVVIIIFKKKKAKSKRQ